MEIWRLGAWKGTVRKLFSLGVTEFRTFTFRVWLIASNLNVRNSLTMCTGIALCVQPGLQVPAIPEDFRRQWKKRKIQGGPRQYE
jgi:hypothetical protein